MSIELPYLPEGREILYVPVENPFMQQAKKLVDDLEQQLSEKYPGKVFEERKLGAVVVKNGVIIGAGTNGVLYHVEHGCERKRQNIPTGTGYELCEGCSPKNHAEQTALRSCNEDPVGADLYLWGHWWCCESCWGKMITAGIERVYLVEGAEKLFKC